MKNQVAIDFLVRILKSYNLSYNFVEFPFIDIPELDLGIRKLLDPTGDHLPHIGITPSEFPSNKLYYARDEFDCSYIFMLLPDTDPQTYFFIGPFLTAPFSNTELYKHAEKFSVPAGLIKQVEHYYHYLPLVSDQGVLLNILTAFAEMLWGDKENFSFEKVDMTYTKKTSTASVIENYEDNDFPSFSVKRVEERYENENAFILAVSQGQFLKAEQFLIPYAFTNFEKRTNEPLRNEKNYSIVLNTLLRKAAEMGSVHPYHIDTISSRFARRIEEVTSIKEVENLHREMVHKYCLLVKNHSMKGYSLLIRKVLTQIDTDLTANLSLNSLANELNVNSSYLSTLFKKETGTTLTEFVNRKRIEHAILLLNTTNLQIQNIAQYCGISDVNYFTKLFKKQIGKTPKEYRESIFPRK